MKTKGSRCTHVTSRPRLRAEGWWVFDVRADGQNEFPLCLTCFTQVHDVQNSCVFVWTIDQLILRQKKDKINFSDSLSRAFFIIRHANHLLILSTHFRRVFCSEYTHKSDWKRLSVDVAVGLPLFSLLSLLVGPTVLCNFSRGKLIWNTIMLCRDKKCAEPSQERFTNS